MKYLKRFIESISEDDLVTKYFSELDDTGYASFDYDSENDTITIKFIHKLKVNEIDNVDINARVEYNNSKNEYYELVKRGIDILSFDYKVKIKTIKTVTLPHLDDNKNNDNFIISLYDKDKSDFYDIENEKLIVYEDEVRKFIKDASFELYSDALSGNQLLINIV